MLLDNLDQWRVVWENSNGAALVNPGERVKVAAIPSRGWKFGDGKPEDDETLSVQGIFIRTDNKVLKSFININCISFSCIRFTTLS